MRSCGDGVLTSLSAIRSCLLPPTMVMNFKREMHTAGGRIQCLRCTARSSRTGFQCGRPALKTSKTHKCQFHGGRGSGPKTAEGKARIAAAHTKHGNETQAMRMERSAASARISRLEDAMHVLGMTTATRSRGRKAQGYVPVRTLDDVRQMVAEELCIPPRGSSEDV